MNRHDLAEDEVRRERLGFRPKGLAALRGINAVEANPNLCPVTKDGDGIAISDTDDLPREIGKGGRLSGQSKQSEPDEDDVRHRTLATGTSFRERPLCQSSIT